MRKIKLVTLSTCDLCKNYKELYKIENIDFEELLCDDQSNCRECDNLEDASNCRFYPMTIINDHIVCITHNYNEIGKLKHIDSNILGSINKVIYCHSINNMFEITKKLLY